jgi:hypothetical protein
MQRVFDAMQPVLDTPFVRHVRRNHGLEHATIHMLSRQIKQLRVVGRSDARGFYLYGNVPTEAVESAVREALDRMRKGEHDLAIHPNCGTNLVTAATLAAAAVFAALAGSERDRGGKLSRLPLVVVGIMGAMIMAQPLGARIQRNVTTLGDPADLEILGVKRHQRGNMTIHRIQTRSS